MLKRKIIPAFLASVLAISATAGVSAEVFSENAYAAENDEASAQNQPFLQNRAKNFADALNACKTEKQTEEQMLWFIRSVIARWNALAEEDAAAEPFRREELELLYFLASSPNQVFTREQLLDHIWGYEYIGDTRTVDVHIKRLREKIKDNPHWSIATVWGIGYKFEVKNP